MFVFERRFFNQSVFYNRYLFLCSTFNSESMCYINVDSKTIHARSKLTLLCCPNLKCFYFLFTSLLFCTLNFKTDSDFQARIVHEMDQNYCQMHVLCFLSKKQALEKVQSWEFLFFFFNYFAPLF